jgi:predicted DNA-binding protein YlxM (UPF0122 family)
MSNNNISDNNIGKNIKKEIKTIQKNKNKLSLFKTGKPKYSKKNRHKLDQNVIHKLDQPKFVAIV